MKIPFYKRPIPWNDELVAVRKVLYSGQLAHGPEVEAFEKEFAKYIGSKYSIAVNSATSGLFLSLYYLKPKRQVFIPTLTFASVANSIIHAGHTIGFDDRFTAGRAYNLLNTEIIDSAHEIHRNQYKNFVKDNYFGGKVKGEYTLVHSFYPTKILSGCEGGMISTNNKEFAEWLRLARNNGRSAQGWNYKILMQGWKMNMNDIQAAIGRVKLRRLDEELGKRDDIRMRYNLKLQENVRSNHLYIILVENREKFMKSMARAGIETSHHYFPLHTQPAFYNKELKANLSYPMSIEWCSWHDRTVSLPFYPDMTDEEVDYVCKKTNEYSFNK